MWDRFEGGDGRPAQYGIIRIRDVHDVEDDIFSPGIVGLAQGDLEAYLTQSLQWLASEALEGGFRCFQ